MPEYRLPDKQDDSEKTSSGAGKELSHDRDAQKIPVHDGNITFHIGDKEAASALPQHAAPAPVKKPPAQTALSKAGLLSRLHLSARVWHLLEFIAVTAVVFTVLFFIINFDSYSRLFMSKLDQLRGQVSNNPYTQEQIQILKTASPEGQKPLPIISNEQGTKKQIPDLNLSIAPPDDRIIIPRIGQNVPIVRVPTDKLIQRDWSALEKQIQEALRYGVVHFPGTAYPGDHGNVVITGHSSYFPWDPGRFKDVFALLHQVDIGDEVVVYHDQQKYDYIVYDKKVVKPSQVDVLTQEGEDRLTLITCTPVGTDLNRLIVLAKPTTS